jgi:hypothetical protein
MRFQLFPCPKIKNDTILRITEIGEEEINRLTSIELAILYRIGIMEVSARTDSNQTFHFHVMHKEDVQDVLRGFCIEPETSNE